MLYIAIMYETFLKFTLLSNSTILSFSLFQGNITKQFSVYYKYNTDDVILVFDATGKPTPSILNGALNWPGDYDECLAVPATYNISQTHYTFQSQYCSVSIYSKVRLLYTYHQLVNWL